MRSLEQAGKRSVSLASAGVALPAAGGDAASRRRQAAGPRRTDGDARDQPPTGEPSWRSAGGCRKPRVRTSRPCHGTPCARPSTEGRLPPRSRAAWAVRGCARTSTSATGAPLRAGGGLRGSSAIVQAFGGGARPTRPRAPGERPTRSGARSTSYRTASRSLNATRSISSGGASKTAELGRRPPISADFPRP